MFSSRFTLALIFRKEHIIFCLAFVLFSIDHKEKQDVILNVQVIRNCVATDVASCHIYTYTTVLGLVLSLFVLHLSL